MNKTQAVNFVESEILCKFNDARLTPEHINDWVKAMADFDFNGSMTAEAISAEYLSFAKQLREIRTYNLQLIREYKERMENEQDTSI